MDSMIIVVLAILSVFGVFIIMWKLRGVTNNYDEESELKEKIINLIDKKERLTKLMEIAYADESMDMKQLLEKQNRILSYLSESFYKYCALLLRYYAVKYIEDLKYEYDNNALDALLLIKKMSHEIEGAYIRIKNEYCLDSNSIYEDENNIIKDNIKEIVNSITIIETNKIIEKLSPIEERNQVVSIVERSKTSISYFRNKELLDREYDRFMAENEIK